MLSSSFSFCIQLRTSSPGHALVTSLNTFSSAFDRVAASLA
jgi:hypothetical protein